MDSQDAYWQGAVADEQMQSDHRFAWKAMLDTIDTDLTGTRVLDAGCNRGGFLRMLADTHAIADGAGYDPASGAIDDARRLVGARPLRFEVGDTVPKGWTGFDVAFSHEVLYLLDDHPAHARAVFTALVPGGSYFAVMGVHDASPLMAEWHRAIRRGDAASQAVRNRRASSMRSVRQDSRRPARRLQDGLRSGRGPHLHTSSSTDTGLVRRLDYYYDNKLLLRFTRPAAT